MVSTDLTEIRITFSPDGKRMLWGLISGEGAADGWQIVESVREGNGWSAPHAVTFNSPQNDFDPFFAPDGSGVYFFSNRPGGVGGDDLYFAPFNKQSGTYGTAQNLGSSINTPADEWAPAISKEGRLLFSSDGYGGAGKHDLFIAKREGSNWSKPENLTAINGPDEDFDAAFLADGKSIIFTRGKFDDIVSLYVARATGAGFAAPVKLDGTINASDTWTMSPAISKSEPGVLYFSSHRAGDPAHSNVYRIAFR